MIISELKKKGYPLENYVQSLLSGKEWHVQPNAYFLDKDTVKGRELDIRAEFADFKICNNNVDFLVYLLVQCKKIPSNAWVFFSVPHKEYVFGMPKVSHIRKLLNVSSYEIFDSRRN